MPLEIRELNIRTTVSPRELLSRIINTAKRGPAGVNAAARGIKKLAATEEGAMLLKEMTQKFTLFNKSGTPMRAVAGAWPAKWTAPTQKSDSAAVFNPHEFTLNKATRWSEAKALAFVKACIGG